MEINQLLERITIVDIATLITLIGMVLAFTKGITEVFKMQSGLYKQVVTVLMAGWLVLMVVLTNPEQQAISMTFVLRLLSTIVLVFFGASGIYNFIPKDKVVEVQTKEIPVFESIDVTEGAE